MSKEVLYCSHKSALAMLGTPESVARINQRLRRIDPDVADNNTPYKEIPLSQGKVALVDAEDYERVSKYKWFANRRGVLWYAIRTDGRTSLHCFLMDAPKHLLVDHKNGDGLDCRRKNMRVATKAQNGMNRRIAADNTSGFKGVYRRGKKWAAQIYLNKERHYLGAWQTPEEAARAYDEAAKRLFGEFARLNFPDDASL